METSQTVHVIHSQPQPTKTSGLAVTSMILGILSILGAAFFLLPPLLAVIFGHLSLGQCKRDPMIGGRGMGLAGLVLGYITLAGGVIWFLFLGGLAVLGIIAGAAGY
jgi:hypothetical protein